MAPDGQPDELAEPGRRHGTVPVRHRRRSRWHSTVLPLLEFTASTLAVVLVSGTVLAGLWVTRFANDVTANAVDISNGRTDGRGAAAPQLGSFDGGFNVLMVGVDNTADQSAAFGDRGGTLNDVNILLHVAADHRSAVVVSIPRDLVIPQPDCTDPVTGDVAGAVSAQPINEAFGRGGLGCVVATVGLLTGLSIPYAGLISFEGTVAMADAVGGVPICLTDPINDPYTGLNLPAGPSVVSGQTALSYLRSRHGVGDGSDLSRISSQQAYMSSLVRVLKSNSTLTDLPKLSRLSAAAGQNLKLSTSLANMSTMVSMALALRDISLDRIVFVQYPSEPNPDNSAKLVPSPDLATELFRKVAADESFALAPDALGPSATLDQASPGPTAPATSVPASAAPSAPPSILPGTNPSAGPVSGPAPAPTPTPTPTPTSPAVLEGLRGQTAAQQTCSEASY
ncbi:LCP family protein [Cryobacterium shii]|uniref:LytR family transcriptional regulator n=1 Tax=Cryobacterium shii TaxID=1259235 RepID=A0AAQ2C924_9MICO|nr:LCP family protein [Cryobacterium shii]TFC52892.1 LytR family transcriptional regulator [Cryobacterium shii]